jgi:hypothetical protein
MTATIKKKKKSWTTVVKASVVVDKGRRQSSSSIQPAMVRESTKGNESHPGEKIKGSHMIILVPDFKPSKPLF